MNAIAGEMYVICPKSDWTGKFNPNCLIIMPVRAGSYNSYRIVILREVNIGAGGWPSAGAAIDPLVNLFRVHWRMSNGHCSMITIKRKAFTRMMVDMCDTFHVQQIGRLTDSMETIVTK